jgi:Domain of unknown function (DUF4190)
MTHLPPQPEGQHPDPTLQYQTYQAPAYAAPYPYMAPPQKSTNGMAIAALVVSCVGVLGLCAYGLGGWIGAIGAILGHVGRRQIRERSQNGDGMALAGIIVGWIATGLFVLAGIAWGIGIWYGVTHADSSSS